MENSNYIKLDTDEVIDGFFDLTAAEKDLVRGMMIHKSMMDSGLKMGNKSGDFKRLCSYSPGIYMAFSIIDKRGYIGQSTRVKERVYGHIGKLRNETHRNPSLQSAYIEHGPENLLFIQLEIVNNILTLNQRERFWMELYDKEYESFNLAPALISELTIIELCKDLNSGLSTSEIADKHNIVYELIMDIRSGRRWEKMGKKYLSDEVKEVWWNKDNWSRFTEEEIIEICGKLNNRMLPHILAEEYGCSITSITILRTGKVWRELGEKHLSEEVKKTWWDKDPLRTLTVKEVVLICNELNGGVPSLELTEIYNFSLSTINKLRSGKIWRKTSVTVLSDEIKEKWWDKDPQTRFEEKEVIEICKKLNRKTPAADLADEFNCSDTIIKHIRRGNAWREIGELQLSEEIKEKYWTTKSRRILSESEVVEICHELNRNTSATVIAKTFSCLSDTVTDIRRGKKQRKIGEIHLNEDVKKKYWETKTRRILSESEVVEICHELNKKTTAKEIAGIFSCLSDTVTDIRRGKKWRKIGEMNLDEELKIKYWKDKINT